MPQIEHLIVLMMENRSFDHMLGFLDHPGLAPLKSGEFPNSIKAGGASFGVTPNADYLIESPDHSHMGVMQQLYGGDSFDKDWRPPTPKAGQPWPPATCRGFVRNYRRLKDVDSGEQAGEVMRCFAPAKVPVLASLAKQYALCTRWFCSLPGNTWSNRDFAIAGTSHGTVNNTISSFHPFAANVFGRMREKKKSWRVYHEDIPHAVMYQPSMALRGLNFRSHQDLLDDIKHHGRRDKKQVRRLPNFAWVEPDYGLGKSGLANASDRGNSQHPGQAGDTEAEFVNGEKLIASIHNALLETLHETNNPEESLFAKTLFLVTYDEHGGFFDHVPPPSATPPDNREHREGNYVFRFDLLGPRVPAVLISPWVKKGTLIDSVYDHASIPATLRSLFDIAELRKRDANPARSFWPDDDNWRSQHLVFGVRTDMSKVQAVDLPASSAAAPAPHDFVHVPRNLARSLVESADLPASALAKDDTQLRAEAIRTLRTGDRVIEISDAHGNKRSALATDLDDLNLDELRAAGHFDLLDDSGRALFIDPKLGSAELVRGAPENAKRSGFSPDQIKDLVELFLAGHFEQIEAQLAA